MAGNLSKGYKTIDEAAMGGFKKIMSGNHPNKFDEYAFFILIVVENSQATYRYTAPEKIGSNGGSLSLTLAKGQVLRAYCHSHPQRITEQNFSADDFSEFKKMRQNNPTIVWYLLTPTEQLRVARYETDFRAGNPVQWVDTVQP
ncbi:MAG: hypothetical protein K1X72_22860 [Pyrinomonadaceae bacterium]|nr:hypothetical protein [Pyrinomonadaceae bacterium]